MIQDEPRIVVIGDQNKTTSQTLKNIEEWSQDKKIQKGTQHPRRVSDNITIPKVLDKSGSSNDKPILILDLDETLIHTVESQPTFPSQEVKIYTPNYIVTFWVAKRPGLDDFLLTMSKHFEIVIYTAGVRDYAEAIITQLGMHLYISRLFHRDHCVHLSDSLIVKDLTIVGENFEKIVFIDDAVRNTKKYPHNSLLVSRFQGDTKDCWLSSMLSPFLMKLKECADFRSVSRKFDLFLLGYDLPKGSSKEGVRIPKQVKAKSENVRMVCKLVSDDSCLDEVGDEGITSSALKMMNPICF